MNTAWSRQRAVIVGGTLGIGLATAKLLSIRGADVCVLSRNQVNIDTAVEEIKSLRLSDGQEVLGVALDVSDEAKVKSVMEHVVSDFGIPDLLVNCAGRAHPARFEKVSFAQFDETMRINLYGCWNACQAMVPHMKAKGGTIVNVSSVAGLMGVFGFTDYSASKFALIGFSEALRGELKPEGITVCVLCPPDTETPGFARENESKPAETRALSESAGVLSADTVAEALLKGVAKGRFLIVPGMEGKAVALAKRFIPGVLEWWSDAVIRKTQKR